MATGTNRTSPQIVSSPNTNRLIYSVQIIYVDTDTLILEITLTNNCLAILQDVTVFNDQNSPLPANIIIVNNGNFTYSVTIDFQFPIIEHIINFMVRWDLTAYNGGYIITLDGSNTLVPFRKQLKVIIKKAIKKFEKEQIIATTDKTPLVPKIDKTKVITQQNIQPNPVYADLDVFSYKLRNKNRFKRWKIDNAALTTSKIDLATLKLNPIAI